MAKTTKKSVSAKKKAVECGPHFNPGKPVVYMVAAILTCLCLSLGGFMIGYNVGVRDALSAEETAESGEDAPAENTTETTDATNAENQ